LFLIPQTWLMDWLKARKAKKEGRIEPETV
jgi:hypothetical protein